MLRTTPDLLLLKVASMEVEVRMPDLSISGHPIKLLAWLVEEGEMVSRGQPLLEIEADKSIMEVEAAIAGKLTAILAQESQEVEVGDPIARLHQTGDYCRAG